MSAAPKHASRFQFTVGTLAIVVCLFGVMLAWYRDRQNFQASQQVLLDQVRSLQEANHQLLMQLNAERTFEANRDTVLSPFIELIDGSVRLKGDPTRLNREPPEPK